MNLLLVDEPDFIGQTRVRFSGRRLQHILTVLKLDVGGSLRVGKLDGPIGSGTVEKIDKEAVEMEIEWEGDISPPPSSITLAFALPRPPTLRKVLQSATALGIKHFDIFQSRRVEKSYWQSPALEESALHEQLLLGLEQCRDTKLPNIEFHRRFKPWAEDRLGRGSEENPVIVADPEGQIDLSSDVKGASFTLVIGPEGGFIPYERELLQTQGATLWSMGPRILRVEHAVIAAISKLS